MGERQRWSRFWLEMVKHFAFICPKIIIIRCFWYKVTKVTDLKENEGNISTTMLASYVQHIPRQRSTNQLPWNYLNTSFGSKYIKNQLKIYGGVLVKLYISKIVKFFKKSWDFQYAEGIKSIRNFIKKTNLWQSLSVYPSFPCPFQDFQGEWSTNLCRL